MIPVFHHGTMTIFHDAASPYDYEATTIALPFQALHLVVCLVCISRAVQPGALELGRAAQVQLDYKLVSIYVLSRNASTGCTSRMMRAIKLNVIPKSRMQTRTGLVIFNI